MYRKWKSVSAFGMAALIGCLMPMGTMMAAEENTEVVQENGTDSVSVIDDGCEDAVIPEYDDADGDAVFSGDDSISSKQIYVQTESIAAPVIDIKWQGQNRTYGLGGAVDYEYVNNRDQAVYCSANQGVHAVTLYYYLENVADLTAEAKGNEQMDSLPWVSVAQSSQAEIFFLKDGSYVVYAKAVGEDGQISYARSGGIVVDTVAPKVIGVQEGETYPEGTVFQVEDANLESVTVNEKAVVPAPDGSYQVIANGTSCVIKAKDKAGNNTTCSITVSEKEPDEESIVISKNGTYSLKAGVAYGLAEGKWKVDNDSTVYWGGSTFYVRADGDYKFTKR